ncbi:Uncharacterised protein [Serratia proteamaculans]|nr:Uncharacterised protein [Serratia proteamaculans]
MGRSNTRRDALSVCARGVDHGADIHTSRGLRPPSRRNPRPSLYRDNLSQLLLPGGGGRIGRGNRFQADVIHVWREDLSRRNTPLRRGGLNPRLRSEYGHPRRPGNVGENRRQRGTVLVRGKLDRRDVPSLFCPSRRRLAGQRSRHRNKQDRSCYAGTRGTYGGGVAEPLVDDPDPVHAQLSRALRWHRRKR